MATATTAPPPWHAAYPSPNSTPSPLPRTTLLSWLKPTEDGGKVAGKEYVLVDLRRADHEGGTISTSINLPAQSLYQSIPVLYTLLSAAGVKHVIWYCGSSRGRGTRAAAWFKDYIVSQKDTTMESLYLEGGIKGWAKAGDVYVSFVDGYEASVWAAFEEA